MLYEFITPSDPITFHAPDNDIAEAVAIYIGQGKAGFRAADNSETPNTLYLFNKMPDEQIARFKKTLDERLDDFFAACKTFAVCSLSDRKIYDDYTQNSTNEEKVKSWDAEKRSSLTDWCGFARSLKRKENEADSATPADTNIPPKAS
jgi:hypothetical protein